jgi:hypothetical protein
LRTARENSFPKGTSWPFVQIENSGCLPNLHGNTQPMPGKTHSSFRESTTCSPLRNNRYGIGDLIVISLIRSLIYSKISRRPYEYSTKNLVGTLYLKRTKAALRLPLCRTHLLVYTTVYIAIVASVTTPASFCVSVTGLATPNSPVQFNPSAPNVNENRCARNVNKFVATSGIGDAATTVNG